MRFLFLVLVVAIAPVTPANPANRQSQPLYPDFVFHPFGEEENSEPIDVEDIIRTFDEDLATAIEEALAGREEPEDEEEEPETSLPPISPADREMRRAQVLTFDTASSGTWLGARQQLDHLLEELRIALISDAPTSEFSQMATEFLINLDLLAEMAPMQAPYQADGIEFQRERMEQQILFMVEDFTEGEFRRVSSTNRLLNRSMSELHTLLARSDIDRGWVATDYSELPGGWNPGNFSSPDFARQIRAWNGRTLISEYRNRHSRLAQAHQRRNMRELVWLTYEMGELARELARRTDEVPTLSREPFRNAALRLDVMAENLRDFITESRRLHSRRQLYAINLAIRDAERYLDLMP